MSDQLIGPCSQHLAGLLPAMRLAKVAHHQPDLRQSHILARDLIADESFGAVHCRSGPAVRIAMHQPSLACSAADSAIEVDRSKTAAKATSEPVQRISLEC